MISVNSAKCGLRMRITSLELHNASEAEIRVQCNYMRIPLEGLGGGDMYVERCVWLH